MPDAPRDGRARGGKRPPGALPVAEALLEVPHVLVVALDTDGRVEVTNQAVCDLTGYSPGQLRGQDWFELVVPRDRFPEVWQAFEKLEGLGVPETFENPILTEDGEQRIIRWHNSAWWEAGQLRGTLSIGIDVTEAREAQAAVREREDRLRSIFEALPIGVFQTTDEGEIIEANPALADLLGYESPQHLVRSDAHDLYVDPSDRERWEQKVAEDGVVTGVRTQLERADGQLRWVELTARRLEEDGQVLYEGTVIDVTDRHEAREALARSEERFRSVHEAAPDAMVTVDGHGVITMVNKRTEELFGWDRHDLVGQPVEVLVPERFRQGHVGQREGYLEDPEARPMGADLELYGLRADGTEFPCEISLSPARTPDGLVVTAAVRDISDRIRRERELERRTRELEEVNRKLEEANEELEAFNQAASHDMRSPLITINGFSQLLAEQYGDQLGEDAHHLLQRLRKAASDLADLLDGLQALSRIKGRELRRETVDLSAMAHQILRDLADQDPEREVAVDIQDGLEVTGDPILLRDMLENLLGNAWKFTSLTEQPRIELGAEQTEGGWTLFVRDNGAGFEPAKAEMLFEPFQRMHAEFEGTGLGLASVHRIVDRHGGRVWAEGEPGQGATFYVRL